jgi:hypothetical protein
VAPVRTRLHHFRFVLILILAVSIYFLLLKQPRDTNLVTLHFTMMVDKETYEMTDFGEPPQLAIWLEQESPQNMRTVWVARRSGRQLWKGKIECPTALPLWESRHQHEKSDYKKRGLLKRLVDAISGATPTGGLFKAKVKVPAGTSWTCWVEVNLSGDFNHRFPYRDSNGMPDPEINGQPSLIYTAKITASPGKQSAFRLIGRSRQWLPVDYIVKDLSGITSAKKAVTDIRVFCPGR